MIDETFPFTCVLVRIYFFKVCEAKRTPVPCGSNLSGAVCVELIFQWKIGAIEMPPLVFIAVEEIEERHTKDTIEQKFVPVEIFF